MSVATSSQDGGVRTAGINGPTGGKTGRGAVAYVVRDEDDKVVLDKGGDAARRRVNCQRM
jgi:hypothetical protein